MVVRIRTGRSIKSALIYNEFKVRQGTADLILASGFSFDVEDLSFYQKVRRFEALNERNTWVKTNVLHLSLNFPPQEILSTEKLQLIALDYMERIGFGRQPFLVYRHSDANHPHIHILTTTIQPTGRAIKIHNIGKSKSEPARIAIEAEYNLIRAQSRKNPQIQIQSAFELLAANYGRHETKHILTNIVGEVIRSYKFADLEEFNAILRQMNVVADPGQPGSKMNAAGGLVYSILDDNGFRIGNAIKASDIYGRPTLKVLQQKFSKNAVKKQLAQPNLEQSIKSALIKSLSADQFFHKLRQRGISLQRTFPTDSTQPRIYFVDHRNKLAVALQELDLSIEGIKRFYNSRPATVAQTKSTQFGESLRFVRHGGQDPLTSIVEVIAEIIKALMTPVWVPTGSASPPLKRKKKRKRRGYSI